MSDGQVWIRVTVLQCTVPTLRYDFMLEDGTWLTVPKKQAAPYLDAYFCNTHVLHPKHGGEPKHLGSPPMRVSFPPIRATPNAPRRTTRSR
jgi:hypothetical protein